MKHITNFVIVAVLILYVAFACSKAIDNGVQSNPPPPTYQDHEPNDSIEGAQFISVFSPPDMCQINGWIMNETDVDVYRWFTPGPQLTSFDIHSANGMVMEAFLYTKNFDDVNLVLIGHWVGDQGHLFIQQVPTVPGNDGIYLKLKSPGGTMGSYYLEVWAQ